jgi:hypothetical protein
LSPGAKQINWSIMAFLFSFHCASPDQGLPLGLFDLPTPNGGVFVLPIVLQLLSRTAIKGG